MSKQLSIILTTILRELPQALTFMALIVVLAWLSDWLPKDIDQPVFAPLMTAVYMLLFLAAFSHIARRILFPKIDLLILAQNAMKSPVASAIVFFAVSIVLAVLIFSFSLMMH